MVVGGPGRADNGMHGQESRTLYTIEPPEGAVSRATGATAGAGQGERRQARRRSLRREPQGPVLAVPSIRVSRIGTLGKVLLYSA